MSVPVERSDWRASIAKTRLPDGELWASRARGLQDAIEAYARSADPYAPEFSPETLLDAKGIRVTKVAVPGIGDCVLKEMSSNGIRGWRHLIEMDFRIAHRRKYRRTFQVALAARAAGIPVYEPHAYWYRREGGRRMFFLCEFVEGPSFETLARRMAYPESDRAAVLSGFRELGGIAARLNDAGIVDADMIPQNCILVPGGDGGRSMKLIDLDLTYFLPHGGRRREFVHRMRALRRFVTDYPLNGECLDAFLDSYSGGNRAYADCCRRAQDILHLHDKRRALAGLLVWLCCPPPPR